MISGTSISPQQIQDQVLAQVGAAVAAGEIQRAHDVATTAMQRGMRHPYLYNARGLWLQQTGRCELAIEEFRCALSTMPGNPTVLNAIGMCFLKLDRNREAVAMFDQALAAAPGVAITHYRRGLALAQAGDHDAAQVAHERAIELDANLADAHASLASILARKAQPERARACAERALSLNPQNGTARLALALIEMGGRNYPEAEQLLRAIPESVPLTAQQRAAVLGLLGDALDGQKRYAEAFQTYVEENEELRRKHAQRFEGLAAQSAENLIAYFRKASPECWTSTDDGLQLPDGPAEHVFLLGFMRSGTTLLEQVLGSNDRIAALEEKGLLHGLGEKFMTSVPALDALADLKGAELEQHRRTYWERVKQTGIDVKGKVFVDKQPLNTVKLPIIAKLFPRAKIIFALRDPRDVVFSCFRRHFKVNLTMFEFLKLEDAARFYALVMELAGVYRDKLPLDIFEHRYEHMVEDFEGSVRAICGYMGVEWTDAMRDFDKYAPAVDLRSPSATQVRKPLYTDALAQWRRYQDQLAPVLPILEPWVRKFGYPSS
jgi:Tfp pilus assembly protein PilF